MEAFLGGLDTRKLDHDVTFFGGAFHHFKVAAAGEELGTVLFKRLGDAGAVFVILRLVGDRGVGDPVSFWGLTREGRVLSLKHSFK